MSVLKFFSILFFINLHICTFLANTCAWNNCPKWNNSLINIHFIPHSHTDQGFVKKSDDYYVGKISGYGNYDIGGVQYIINNVIAELLKDTSRRFSFCETGFLKQWWDNHKDAERQKLVQLVETGQLELIGGGWVQPDEAASHYVDLIDQYTLGLGILNQTFGECGHPKVLWQIDPFGHSREHANLGKMMGYESLFFSREHYLEHEMRWENKSLDLIWHVSDDNGNNITTTQFYDSYEPPNGFCFDVNCVYPQNDPIVDNPEIESYNLDTKLAMFMTSVNEILQTQRHNHVLILMGKDYAYIGANLWYENIDKLIYHLNQNSNITAFYSTPSCYNQARTEQLNSFNYTWPEKSDDFFPLAQRAWWVPGTQDNTSYWTGFYTSKPAMKGLTRKSSALLQLTRQMSSMALLQTANQLANITLFEKAMAISQHHDAITGTSQENVTQDYIYRQMNGWTAAEQVLNVAINAISNNLKNNNASLPTQVICRNINESECFITSNSNNFSVTVYNSYGQNLNTLVRIPLYQSNNIAISLLDSNGNPISYQIMDVFSNTGQINNMNMASKEVVFMADVKPLGFKTYFVFFVSVSSGNNVKNVVKEKVDLASNSISNGLIQLDFDSQGLLSTYHDLITNKTYSLKQEILYYHGYNDSFGEQPSGAYIFRPENTTHNFTNISLSIINTSLVSEARQIMSPWVSQVIRLIPNKAYVEFEWTIGPIPADNNISKEVITRYTLDNFNSNATFWTDANGRQLVKRIRNHKALYQYDNTEPIAANYYPVDTRILISNGSTTMGVLTDRSHGGSSLVDGQIELMLHRRLFYDDFLGLNQALNEPGRDGRGLVARGKHWLFLGNADQSSQMHRSLASEMYHSPVLTFAGNISMAGYQNSFVTEFSALKQPLPPNINLLTLKPLDQGNLLLRLEHFYSKNEDANLSKPATIDLNNLFSTINISKITEMSLAANNFVGVLSNSTITLNPMEIKTYILTIGTVPNNPTSVPMTTVTPNSLTSATAPNPSTSATTPNPSTSATTPNPSTSATTPNPSNTTVPNSGNGLIVSINLFIFSFILYFYMLTN